VFDRVLFATSIDHVLVPELALAEAYRVASRGGTVCIWLGEVAPPGLTRDLRPLAGGSSLRFRKAQ
jgi:ubiquinone/menaquinone biosynthesis C-methylase UbiE